MRHIGNRLRNFQKRTVLNLVEQHRKNNRNEKAKAQLDDADANGIAEYVQRTRRGQELFEEFHSYPLAAPDALGQLVILKRDDQTAHRRIAEYKHPDKAREKEQKKHLVAPDSFPYRLFRSYLKPLCPTAFHLFSLSFTTSFTAHDRGSIRWSAHRQGARANRSGSARRQ